MKRSVFLFLLAVSTVSLLWAQGKWNGGVLTGGRLGVASSSHTNIVNLLDGQILNDQINIGRRVLLTDAQSLTDSIAAVRNGFTHYTISLIDSMSANVDAITQGNVDFVATFPQKWINVTEADPPGGLYDQSFTVGAAEPHGYTCTAAGIQKIITDWACNFDHTTGACSAGNVHYADQWWHVTVPHTCTVQVSSYTNNTGIFVTGKLNPTTGAEPTKYLVFESDTPLPPNRMPCSHGLPGFGGTRNPGCTNDVAQMWSCEQMSNPLPGNSCIAGGPDQVINTVGPNGYTWSNHVVFRDLHAFMAGGAAQSGIGKATIPINFDGNVINGAGVFATHIGLERIYVHGNDPGDPGQPAGPCVTGSNHGWRMSGTLNVAADGVSATWVSGDRFGMTFLPGATVTINSVNYTIAAHDPSTSDTTFTIVAPGTGGALSAATFALVNPPAQYANGCGDDVENLVKFNVDSSWIEHAYLEKTHWANAESHTLLYGFSNGPLKLVDIWSEAGSSGFFSGGGPVDQNGGPAADIQIGRVYLGRDLNYRQLSASAGNSPAPPYGCGPLVAGTAKNNTCPFTWAIKNSSEYKLGQRVLVSGFICDGTWPDGQSGSCLVVTLRTISGGSAAGIYDPATGLPRTALNNLHFENGIVENSTQGIAQATRAFIPTDGGGVSQGIYNLDYYNIAFVNLSDGNQFGTAGSNLVQWALDSNEYYCNMTRASGTVHAACRPIPLGYGTCAAGPAPTYPVAFPAWPDAVCKSGVAPVTSVSRNAGITKVIFGGKRQDPTVGGTFLATDATTPVTAGSTWGGTFTIRYAYQGNTQLTNDGTTGDSFDYVDSNLPSTATLCTTQATCAASGFSFVMPTLAYKLTDISVGDNIYVPSAQCTGGTNPTSFGAGLPIPAYAIAPTVPTGLDVYWSQAGPDDSSGTSCLVLNGSGYPKGARFHHNVIASPGANTILQFGQQWQSYNNHFYKNIFATTGNHVDLVCNGTTGEGGNAYACFDANTFQWYGSTLQGRSAASWPTYPSTGFAANLTPATASCSGPTPDATCIGWQGFMNGKTFPTSVCPDANAPFNCPLLGPPWSSNFHLSDLTLLSGSSSLGQGPNISAIYSAMNQTQYVCPAGVYCGTTGPYSDNHAYTGPALYVVGIDDHQSLSDSISVIP